MKDNYHSKSEIYKRWNYLLLPSSNQESIIRYYSECCELVFNKALELQNEVFAKEWRRIKYCELCNMLTQWLDEEDKPMLSKVPEDILKQSLRNLYNAWKAYIKKITNKPRLKEIGHTYSFRVKENINLDEQKQRISLPGLGWIPYRQHRNIQGNICSVTVKLSYGKWYISILTKCVLPEPVHPHGRETALGIDMGIVRLATFSDENKDPLQYPKTIKSLYQALKKERRRLKRMVEGGKNWEKECQRIQRIRERIANVTGDYRHQSTSDISRNHAIVAVEDLKIKGMSRCARKQGWGELRRQLQYKCDWKGSRFVAVNPKNTSVTCPKCGCVQKNNRKKQAKFKCVKCGYANNADIVAAKNILKKGLEQIAKKVGSESPL